MSELLIKSNKYARFKYNLDKKYEAGIVLKGDDVKAIRAHEFELREAFVREENGELYAWNIIFFKNKNNGMQKLKLLLHKKEIEKIIVTLRDKKIHGFITAIKLNDKNKIKVEIGIGTVKKARDKKASEKRTSEKRQLERSIHDL